MKRCFVDHFVITNFWLSLVCWDIQEFDIFSSLASVISRLLHVVSIHSDALFGVIGQPVMNDVWHLKSFCSMNCVAVTVLWVFAGEWAEWLEIWFVTKTDFKFERHNNKKQIDSAWCVRLMCLIRRSKVTSVIWWTEMSVTCRLVGFFIVNTAYWIQWHNIQCGGIVFLCFHWKSFFYIVFGLRRRTEIIRTSWLSHVKVDAFGNILDRKVKTDARSEVTTSLPLNPLFPWKRRVIKYDGIMWKHRIEARELCLFVIFRVDAVFKPSAEWRQHAFYERG